MDMYLQFTREEGPSIPIPHSRFKIYGNGWLVRMVGAAAVAISNSRAFEPCILRTRNSIFKCQIR